MPRPAQELLQPALSPEDQRHRDRVEEAVRRGEEELRLFEQVRDSLKPEHSGKWVVLRSGQVEAIEGGFQEAAAKAAELFPDGHSLIAPVDDEDAPRGPLR